MVGGERVEVIVSYINCVPVYCELGASQLISSAFPIDLISLMADPVLKHDGMNPLQKGCAKASMNCTLISGRMEEPAVYKSEDKPTVVQLWSLVSDFYRIQICGSSLENRLQIRILLRYAFLMLS